MVNTGVVQLSCRETRKLSSDTLNKTSEESDWDDNLDTMAGTTLGATVVTFFIGNVIYTTAHVIASLFLNSCAHSIFYLFIHTQES